MNPISISVVVPVFNEEETVKELVERTTNALRGLGADFEIILIDDGSTDSTRAKIKELSKKYKEIRSIFFSRNFGHQSAVSAGLQHARGETVVVMDGDLQDPPETIPKMWQLHKDGNHVVYGVRTKRKENVFKRLAYYVHYRLMNKITSGVKMPLDAGDFSLMSREVVDAINNLPEKNRYVRGLRSWVGFKQTSLVYERDARFAGVPKYNFSKLLKLAYDGIFSFSYIPIVLVTWFGVFAAVVSFIGILTILGLKIWSSTYIPGFASTSIFILFIGGIQMLSLGIVGEYVKRIYDETKGRPLYIISEKVNIE